MSFEVVTFGCRLNIFESEQIKNAANVAGLKDAIIINSCAVTSEAERKLQKTIRRLSNENPTKQIIITGCAAQIDPQKYQSFPGVSKVLGNIEKTDPKSYALNSKMVQVSDIMSVEDLKSDPISGFEGKARGYIQVQNGCNHRCTFCKIPFGRGNSRSLPVGEIVSQAKLLVSKGYNELVLTGVDMTDYGKDLPGQPSLGEMVKRLLSNVSCLTRLRFSSIDVAEIDDILMDIILYEQRLMPHLHLSLQAGDDMILKRMKRRHNRSQVIEFCNYVRSIRPEIAFGADIIAGFPTESDEMFQNTLKIIEEAGIIHLHVFPYSERESTPASRMPQVQKQVRKERAKILRDEGARLLALHLKGLVGKRFKVVLEDNGFGRLPDYSLVRIAPDSKFSDDYFKAGEIVEVEITACEPRYLLGSVVCG